MPNHARKRIWAIPFFEIRVARAQGRGQCNYIVVIRYFAWTARVERYLSQDVGTKVETSANLKLGSQQLDIILPWQTHGFWQVKHDWWQTIHTINSNEVVNIWVQHKLNVVLFHAYTIINRVWTNSAWCILCTQFLRLSIQKLFVRTLYELWI